MAERRDPGVEEQEARARSIRVLGWLSGLGVLVVPWLAAGVLSSVGGILRPEAWNPEGTFGGLFLVSLLGWLGWVAYGSVRIRGFRRGALLGSVIGLVVLGVPYLLVLTLQR